MRRIIGLPCESGLRPGNERGKWLNREKIETDGAPAAIGPYSQAIRWGNLLFCSGQIALDPATGELVGADAAAQARQSLQNLRAVLEAGGASPGSCLQVTLYLADMGDFAAVNEVWADFFPAPHPALAAVAVAALPKGALVEVVVVAAAG